MDDPDCPDISFFMLTFRTGVGMIIGLRFGPGIQPGTLCQDFRPGLRTAALTRIIKTIIQERIRREILRRERIRIPCF
ncbi:MAG TPA: hypothetical protein DCP64_15750 [Sarcina sp.]|nr:hypothetical protein [Sarcina sp.]